MSFFFLISCSLKWSWSINCFYTNKYFQISHLIFFSFIKSWFFIQEKMFCLFHHRTVWADTICIILKILVYVQFSETVEEKTFITTTRMGSEMDLENYQTSLEEVLTWLLSAEDALQAQGDISNDVEVVKEQFHTHEVYIYTNPPVVIYLFVSQKKVKKFKTKTFLVYFMLFLKKKLIWRI